MTVTVTCTYYASTPYVSTYSLLDTRSIYNWFSVPRVVRSCNGTTVTLFYTSQESVSRLCLKNCEQRQSHQRFQLENFNMSYGPPKKVNPGSSPPASSRQSRNSSPTASTRSASAKGPASFVPKDTRHVLLRGSAPTARPAIDLSHSPPQAARGTSATMSKTGPATSSPSYASAASKLPASSGYSPPSSMFPTAAGRKPHVCREVATVLGVGANRGQPHAPKSRPSSNSPLSSPFENISAPFAQTAPEQAILASELSVRLEPLVRDG